MGLANGTYGLGQGSTTRRCWRHRGGGETRPSPVTPTCPKGYATKGHGLAASLALGLCCVLSAADVSATRPHGSFDRSTVFPRAHWKTRTATALDLDGGALDAFVAKVGGTGVIVRDGYIVRSWGNVDERLDWASALKSFLSTLLS